MIRKGLAVAVILLFIGVALAPTINSSVVKDELVEFDVELCGLNKSYTVQLTQQQAKEVYVIFDDIKQRLSGIETKEETKDIFTEAIYKLDNLGLLAEVSVSQAVDLILQPKQDDAFATVFKTMSVSYPHLFESGNYLCSVAGTTTNTDFSHRIFRILNIFSTVTFYPLKTLGSKAFEIFHKMISRVRSIVIIIYDLFPFLKIRENSYAFLHLLDWLEIYAMYLSMMITAFYVNLPGVLMDLYGSPKENKFYAAMVGNDRWGAADGWVETVGVNGNIYWNGTLWGQLPLLPHFAYVPGFGQEFFYYYPGIMGFKGIAVWNEDVQGWGYIGNALWVNLGSEHPDNPWIP